jgi:hypothetical protein
MATSESTRARRFALPDLDDERTGESIEAFLEGPEVRRGRPAPRPEMRVAPPPRASGDLRTPAAVAIVELMPDRAGQSLDPWLKSIAGPIARTLRSDSRATDLVARVASTRFQMLLPETSEAGAERLAERVLEGCRTLIESTGAPMSIRVSVAGTGLDTALPAALAEALRSLEAA